MRQITLRQRRILDFIQDRMAHHGMPPTRAEICAALGFRSPNAAEQHLRALARKGAIELLPGTSRGIRLPHKGTLQPAQDRMPDLRTPTCYGLTPVQDRMPGAAGLPLVGRVAAGSPILSEEHIEQRLPLDPRLFQPRADYLLRVQGLSMRDAGILDGDLLAVHRTTEVKEGQVVVARLDDEVTVKRFHRRGSRVTLAPANPDFDPIEVDLTRRQFTIEGRGVGLLRNGEKL